MKPIDQAADQFLETLRAMQAKRISLALAEVNGQDSARSTAKLLRARKSECLSSLLPTKLKPSELFAVADDDDIRNAEQRLRQCARCPVSGGACVGRYNENVGQEPYWDEYLRYRQCGKWPEYLLRESLREFGVPERMREKTLDNFDAKTEAQRLAKDVGMAYANNFMSIRNRDPNGVLFYGTHGIGKTHLAAAVTRAAVERKYVRSAMFVSVTALLGALRTQGDEPQRVMARASNADLLVLDDLGAQRTTDWVREQLGQILDDRWSNRRPVICTSNHELGKYVDMLGERSLSRLLGMLELIELDGSDQRRA